MNSLAFLWRNGGRPLVLSVAVGIVAFSFLGVALLATTYWPESAPFAPLTVSDVTINSPTVQAGQHYNGTITICNADDQQHTITFIMQLERLEGSVHFVSLGSMEFPVEPGCATLTGDSAALPPTVTPGQWRESSVAVVRQGDQRQSVSFVSDPFEVVP